jgi:hypothetical protein
MRTRALSALLGCVGALALSTSPAGAAPDPSAAAMVRGAHFSPDTPSVDVYLTSFAGGTTTLALSNVGYGDISGYQRLQPGLYTVGMRPAGADPSTPAAISWKLDAKPGSAFTAMAIGMHQSLQGRVLSDDLTPPPAGQSRVRIIQAAERVPKADITAENGPVLGAKVPFTTSTDYKTVPAGSWPVTARSTDDPNVTTTTPVTLTAGHAGSVVLLDAPKQGISVRFVDDAIGTDLPPTGPVAAGGGSTATPAHTRATLPVAAWAITGLTLTATIVLAAAAVRRPARRP